MQAQVFFALWLAPLGYLAYRSRLFPKLLGIILGVATVSYLADVVVALLLPDLTGQVHGFLSVAPAIAEIWMVFYLLIVGVRSPRTAALNPPTADADAALIPASLLPAFAPGEQGRNGTPKSLSGCRSTSTSDL